MRQHLPRLLILGFSGVLATCVVGCVPQHADPPAATAGKAPGETQGSTASTASEQRSTSAPEQLPALESPPGASATTAGTEPSRESAAVDERAAIQAASPAEPTESGAAAFVPPEATETTTIAPVAPRVVTGDWPLWGGSAHRNMVNASTGVVLDFEPAADPAQGKKILWTAKLGSQTYGNPVVAQGKVLVGTNNGNEYRPQHKGDRGCVLCFDEKTGKFLWQLTREKLAQGRANDWPLQGICSTAAVDGDRLWVVTNRCELMCLDLEGFHDGENDGPVVDEVDHEAEDADIVWSLDMMNSLGVQPHNLATSSPVFDDERVYVLTSNGVDEAHSEVPAPQAPSFLAVNKQTGSVVWQDNTPQNTILDGQWSSPALADVNGVRQVFLPGGNGWLYALNAKTGEPIWKFDLNPKDSSWNASGRGNRNSIISTPVFVDNSVVLAVGSDPEHGEGVGHLYRIDATKSGDVSAELDADGDGKGEPNPNSGQLWHYGGVDADGSITGEAGANVYRRTITTAAVHEGLVYAADLSGRLHCVDFQTGRRYWEADLLAAVWGSPMVVDGKVLLGDEDGDLSIFATGRELQLLREITFDASIYSTPTVANGVLFISDRSRLYAISTE